ncbi:RIP homotypic interaction motif-containing protein [Streptomyces sp. RFCAC02]|uniref:RIP homotypic interaction motif-containing protein n=1 Tax=Streptomyces sp. RFCAC02 TaxID=2499143 RepID=UPI001F103F5E|nr:RIP homotypic interaction motif-containing protein [Streptomyces sp. RFCAC02]
MVIASALAAGAAAAAQDVASAAVQDAYTALRESVRRLFAGRRGAEETLDRHAADPGAWQASLEEALTEAGAADDARLLAAARDVLRAIGREEGRPGEPPVDLRHARGVQVGDHNEQHNTFS